MCALSGLSAAWAGAKTAALWLVLPGAAPPAPTKARASKQARPARGLLPDLNGAQGNANRRELELRFCQGANPKAAGRTARWAFPRTGADRALVNGAAPASPPSASIANARRRGSP